jgi:hypothetical protein
VKQNIRGRELNILGNIGGDTMELNDKQKKVLRAMLEKEIAECKYNISLCSGTDDDRFCKEYEKQRKIVESILDIIIK